eukprot:15468284-Alexandrium_andersonii.AAC.1
MAAWPGPLAAPPAWFDTGVSWGSLRPRSVRSHALSVFQCDFGVTAASSGVLWCGPECALVRPSLTLSARADARLPLNVCSTDGLNNTVHGCISAVRALCPLM